MSKVLYVQAINRALLEEMERDPNVVLIGLDIDKQGGLFGATRGAFAGAGSSARTTGASKSVARILSPPRPGSRLRAVPPRGGRGRSPGFRAAVRRARR